jgi:hypothetical protein
MCTGPGLYNVQERDRFSSNHGPAFSFKGRYGSSTRMPDSPGPAAYDSAATSSSRVTRGSTFGAGHHLASSASHSPGPGAYSSEGGPHTPRQGTMGARYQHSTPQSSPGAAEGEQRERDRERERERERESVCVCVCVCACVRVHFPYNYLVHRTGPAAYDPSTVTRDAKSHGPAYSIPGRSSSLKTSSGPGPGDYDVASLKSTGRAPGPKLAPRTSSTPHKTDSTDSPGPGAYDLNGSASRAKGYSISGRPNLSQQTWSPGAVTVVALSVRFWCRVCKSRVCPSLANKQKKNVFVGLVARPVVVVSQLHRGHAWQARLPTTHPRSRTERSRAARLTASAAEDRRRRAAGHQGRARMTALPAPRP